MGIRRETIASASISADGKKILSVSKTWLSSLETYILMTSGDKPDTLIVTCLGYGTNWGNY